MKSTFLNVNGTEGTGKSLTLCGISPALGREDVVHSFFYVGRVMFDS